MQVHDKKQQQRKGVAVYALKFASPRLFINAVFDLQGPTHCINKNLRA